jgi:uncharacterized protein (DUF2267 family)
MSTAIDYHDFIATVRNTAHIPDEEAERVACATLQTLGERISTGETEDLAERLPDELRSCLLTADARDRFHVDEFIRRISRRAGLDPSSAERDARAVFGALWLAVGPDEFADMRSELPKDFDPLLDDALREPPPPGLFEPASPDAMSYEDFIGRVAERAHLDAERARRATDAVLEELAIRITGGQVEDLERLLTPELRPPLERGRTRSGGVAQPLSLDTFLAEVARREGVDRDQATEHARAVLSTLREAVGEKEWHDTTEQLPDEYRTLWRRG